MVSRVLHLVSALLLGLDALQTHLSANSGSLGLRLGFAAGHGNLALSVFTKVLGLGAERIQPRFRTVLTDLRARLEPVRFGRLGIPRHDVALKDALLRLGVGFSVPPPLKAILKCNQ